MAGLETVRTHGVAGEKLRGSASVGNFHHARFAAFSVAAHHSDLRAGLGHRGCAGAAEGTSGADHYGYFISQVK